MPEPKTAKLYQRKCEKTMAISFNNYKILGNDFLRIVKSKTSLSVAVVGMKNNPLYIQKKKKKN